MEGDRQRINFQLGREVSQDNFFQSSYARHVVNRVRSLDRFPMPSCSGLHRRGPVAGPSRNNDNQFISLDCNRRFQPCGINNLMTERERLAIYTEQIRNLQRHCQTLTKDNKRFHELLEGSDEPGMQQLAYANLENQVEGLTWKLEEAESNQLLFKTLLRQVCQFLECAKKSLDHLGVKNAANNKGRSSFRAYRTQSVYVEPSTSCSSATTPISGESTSQFSRAKSVTQIPTNTNRTTHRDFTWWFHRQEMMQKLKEAEERIAKVKLRKEFSKTLDDVVYRPKRTEENAEEQDGDIMPPEKLAQEAMRLKKSIETVIQRQECGLDYFASSSSSPALSSANISLWNTPSGASTPESNEGAAGGEEKTNTPAAKQPQEEDGAASLLVLNEKAAEAPAIQSLNFIIMHKPKKRSLARTVAKQLFRRGKNSTPKDNTKGKDEDKKETDKDGVATPEDESGFSSLTSFHELTSVITPMKGGRTEINLPGLLQDKDKRRRWSTTPVELQSAFRRCSIGVRPDKSKTEISVWV